MIGCYTVNGKDKDVVVKCEECSEFYPCHDRIMWHGECHLPEEMDCPNTEKCLKTYSGMKEQEQDVTIEFDCPYFKVERSEVPVWEGD